MKTFWTVFFTSLFFGVVAGAQYPTNAPILGPDLRIASAISGGKLNLVGGNLVVDAGFKDTSTVEASFNGPLTCNGAVSFDGGIYANGPVFFDAGTTMLNGNLVVDGGTVLYGTLSVDGGVNITGTLNASGVLTATGSVNANGGVTVANGLGIGLAGSTGGVANTICLNAGCTAYVNTVGYTSAAASGSTAVGLINNGARVDFGSGALDYCSSDGTTVQFFSAVRVDAGFYTEGSVFLDAGTTMLNGNLVVDGGTVLYGTLSVDGGVNITGNINLSGTISSPLGGHSLGGSTVGSPILTLAPGNTAQIDLQLNTSSSGVIFQVNTASVGATMNIDYKGTLQSSINDSTTVYKYVQVPNSQFTTVGTGADTTEDNLMSFTLVAAALSTNGQGVRVTAFGDGVNTANATTVRCYFGATAVITDILGSAQANTWRTVFEVIRKTATTQTATATFVNGGTVTAVAQANSTPGETLSGTVVIKCTGQRATSSVLNSIQQQGMIVEYFN